MKMKFTKMTHLSIIVVLAIMFIVVYLYYTISDVKKIHNEVSKLSQDIEKMNHSIASITSTIMPLLTGPAPVAYPSAAGQCEMPASAVCVRDPVKASVVPQQQMDTVSSVDSQELNTIMETIDDEHEEDATVSSQPLDITNLPPSAESDTNASLDATVSMSDDVIADLAALPLEDLKKASYEDIRKYCKANNISYKGSKDVLIYRIKGITA